MRRLVQTLFMKTRQSAQVLRPWAPTGRIFTTKKAQALVELAIFGSVLLLVFSILLRHGMGVIYSQSTLMRSFRRGFAHASGSPSTSYRNVSYMMIEDKPMFAPDELLPIATRTAMVQNVDAVRSIDMFGQMEYGVTADLPRVDFDINGTRHTFTTAGFKSYTEHDNMYKKEFVSNWDGSGSYWYWKTVSSAGEGDYVDVDGDGYEEWVMSKSGSTLNCLDYQEGEVNMSKKLTPSGREAYTDQHSLRSLAVMYSVPYITTISGASAAVNGIEFLQKGEIEVKPLQDYHTQYET